MVPLGWKTAAAIVSGMPEKISEDEWNDIMTRNIALYSARNVEFLKNGCVALTPHLLLSNNHPMFALSGVNCAYIKAPSSAESTIKIVSSLYDKGVRAFSIFIYSLSCPISGLLSQLIENVTKKTSVNSQSPSFTVWAEMHSKRLLEYIAECSNDDAMCFASSKKVSTNYQKHHASNAPLAHSEKDISSSEKSTSASPATAIATCVGVLVPKLFFELLSAENSTWYFHEGKASSLLSNVHGTAYNIKYKHLKTKSEGAVSLAARNVLSMLVRTSVSNATKFVIMLRDSCHSLRAAETGASTVWNESVSDAPIFPNHLGEVPLVSTTDITLQFAAFINVERTREHRQDNKECCRSAYSVLNRILRRHLETARDYAKDGILVSLSSAVGIIGLHDAVDCNENEEETEESRLVCRPVLASDIERVVVPLVKSGNPVFPMSGTLPSILWRVAPGAWTCQTPYWLYTGVTGAPVVVPSGAFARFCDANAVSLDHRESVDAAGRKFASYFSRKANNRLISSRVEAQIHQLRKLCSSFFSTTSMPLTIAHEDAQQFQNADSLLLFLTQVVLKNANNDCPVLLPEIRTSKTDLQIARERKDSKRNVSSDESEATGSTVANFVSKCLKRRRPCDEAIVALEKFLDHVVARLQHDREAEKHPVALYALRLFEILMSQKVEDIL